MKHATRRLLVRANGAYLGVASSSALCFDLGGIYFGLGPQGRVLAAVPQAGIGFVEAHGLALILSVLLWTASPSRKWHLTALAIEVLLGTANLLFWQMFVQFDALMLGYVTTILHWSFVVLQLWAVLPEVQSTEAAPVAR